MCNFFWLCACVHAHRRRSSPVGLRQNNKNKPKQRFYTNKKIVKLTVAKVVEVVKVTVVKVVEVTINKVVKVTVVKVVKVTIVKVGECCKGIGLNGRKGNDRTGNES